MVPSTTRLWEHVDVCQVAAVTQNQRPEDTAGACEGSTGRWGGRRPRVPLHTGPSPALPEEPEGPMALLERAVLRGRDSQAAEHWPAATLPARTGWWGPVATQEGLLRGRQPQDWGQGHPSGQMCDSLPNSMFSGATLGAETGPGRSVYTTEMANMTDQGSWGEGWWLNMDSTALATSHPGPPGEKPGCHLGPPATPPACSTLPSDKMQARKP